MNLSRMMSSQVKQSEQTMDTLGTVICVPCTVAYATLICTFYYYYYYYYYGNSVDSSDTSHCRRHFAVL